MPSLIKIYSSEHVQNDAWKYIIFTETPFTPMYKTIAMHRVKPIIPSLGEQGIVN